MRYRCVAIFRGRDRPQQISILAKGILHLVCQSIDLRIQRHCGAVILR